MCRSDLSLALNFANYQVVCNFPHSHVVSDKELQEKSEQLDKKNACGFKKKKCTRLDLIFLAKLYLNAHEPLIIMSRPT